MICFCDLENSKKIVNDQLLLFITKFFLLKEFSPESHLKLSFCQHALHFSHCVASLLTVTTAVFIVTDGCYIVILSDCHN